MSNNAFERLNVISDALSEQSDRTEAFDERFGKLQDEISGLRQKEQTLREAELNQEVESIHSRAQALIEGTGGVWNNMMVIADDNRGPKSKRGKRGKIRHIS